VAGATLPVLQGVQSLEASAMAKRPGEHLVQLAARLWLNCPTTQTSHPSMPVLCAYSPDEQLRHWSDPNLAAYVPW